MRKILFACTIALIFISIGFAAFQKTPWIVPPAEKARKNPLTASDANTTAAKQIFLDHCANCHGDAGKGDGSDAMMYDPAPADLTDAARLSKITEPQASTARWERGKPEGKPQGGTGGSRENAAKRDRGKGASPARGA